MTNPNTEALDPRIERVLLAAEQHGANSEPDHEVGDLQDVLRSAWSLMSREQRDGLMAAAETLDVLQHGEDFVEVARLRGCLLRDDGVHRVLIEVTRDGGNSEPRVTSLKVFDEALEEFDWRETAVDPSELKLLAGRLDDELLQAMPPQEVVPAWVSTIDWDLDRDVLTRSVRMEGVDLDIRPSRWLDASQALDRYALPDSIEAWQAERRVVMELRSSLGRAMPGWAELTLNTSALEELRAGASVELGGAALPVRAGGAAPGKLPSQHFSEPSLEVLEFGEAVQLRGYNADRWVMDSGRVSLRLFLQWADARPAGETLFVSESGQLLNDTDDFARHHLWVEEYHRALPAAFADAETEFDGDRPRMHA